MECLLIKSDTVDKIANKRLLELLADVPNLDFTELLPTVDFWYEVN